MLAPFVKPIAADCHLKRRPEPFQEQNSVGKGTGIPQIRYEIVTALGVSIFENFWVRRDGLYRRLHWFCELAE